MVTEETAITKTSSNTEFTGIQKAISAAKEGDIIKIDKGTYRENLLINKDIVLIGEDAENTFLMPADDRRPTIMIVLSGKHRHVVLSNITIFTCSVGIEVLGSRSQEVIIEKNKIIGGCYNDKKEGIGVRLLGNIYVSICDNFIGHLSTGIFVSGKVLAEVQRNQISENYTGIVIEGRSKVTASENQISYNDDNGIRMNGKGLLDASQNRIMNNKGWGIYLENQPYSLTDTSFGIKGEGNRLSNNHRGNLHPEDYPGYFHFVIKDS